MKIKKRLGNIKKLQNIKLILFRFLLKNVKKKKNRLQLLKKQNKLQTLNLKKSLKMFFLLNINFRLKSKFLKKKKKKRFLKKIWKNISLKKYKKYKKYNLSIFKFIKNNNIYKRKLLKKRGKYISYKKRKKLRYRKLINLFFFYLGYNNNYLKKELNDKVVINVILNKLINSFYRWLKKEYIFLLLIKFNIKNFLKKFILNYYKYIYFLKKNLNKIKENIYFSFFFIKNIRKKTKVNLNIIKLILKKKKVLILFFKKFYKINNNLLRKYLLYLNKFLKYLNSELFLKKRIKQYKEMVYKSYIINVVDDEEIIPLLSINNFLVSNYKIVKKRSLFIYDRVFSRGFFFKNVNKFKYNYIKLISKYNENKKTFSYFFSFLHNKEKQNFNFFLFNIVILVNFMIFFFKKKKFLFNNIKLFIRRNKKLEKKISYKKNLNFNMISKRFYTKFWEKEKNIYKLNNIAIKKKELSIFYENLNKIILFNKKIIENTWKKDNLQKKLKENLLKKQKKYKKLKIIKYYLNLYLFKISLIINILLFLKKWNEKIFVNFLFFIKKNNNYFLKNRFIIKNFLRTNWLENKNKLYEIDEIEERDEEMYDIDNRFFNDLKKNYIYIKYSKTNQRNKKKCVIYYIKKKTNNFLVLTDFRDKKVIGHTSGGQALDRRYFNSKRQKLGTRCLTSILFMKFRPRIKKKNIKQVIIKTNSLWNFRVKHLTKYWVLKYKLGVKKLKSVHVGNKIAHHKGLKKSNKRRK